MSDPRIGSLCSGTGALDLGLMSVVGGSVAWHCENDPHAAKVLDRHWPDVPNHGDLTKVQWTPPCETCGTPTVLDRHGVPTYRCDRCCRLWPTSYFPDAIEPVDWLTAGYSCQPFSQAGQRKGEADERYIWPHIADAIRVLRPGNVLLENVAGHVSLGLDRVIADLAAMGYVGRYGVVRASDAGAPHIRARVFVVATDTDRVGPERAGRAWGRWRGPADLGEPLTDADESGQQGRESAGRHDLPTRRVASDTDMRGRESCTQLDRESSAHPADRSARWGHAHRYCDLADCAVARDWRTADGRDYGPAVRRWHDLTRCVPPPTVPDGRNGAHRLSPRFTEWMQGLPAGWVTDILPRNPALKALGNGVVPAQCALAVGLLLPLGGLN